MREELEKRRRSRNEPEKKGQNPRKPEKRRGVGEGNPREAVLEGEPEGDGITKRTRADFWSYNVDYVKEGVLDRQKISYNAPGSPQMGR